MGIKWGRVQQKIANAHMIFNIAASCFSFLWSLLFKGFSTVFWSRNRKWPNRPSRLLRPNEWLATSGGGLRTDREKQFFS